MIFTTITTQEYEQLHDTACGFSTLTLDGLDNEGLLLSRPPDLPTSQCVKLLEPAHTVSWPSRVYVQTPCGAYVIGLQPCSYGTPSASLLLPLRTVPHIPQLVQALRGYALRDAVCFATWELLC